MSAPHTSRSRSSSPPSAPTPASHVPQSDDGRCSSLSGSHSYVQGPRVGSCPHERARIDLAATMLGELSEMTTSKSRIMAPNLTRLIRLACPSSSQESGARRGEERARMQTRDSSALIATPRHDGASCLRPPPRRSHICLTLRHPRLSFGPQCGWSARGRTWFSAIVGVPVPTASRFCWFSKGPFCEAPARPKDINRCQCSAVLAADSCASQQSKDRRGDDDLAFRTGIAGGDGIFPLCVGVNRRSHEPSTGS